MNETFVTMSGYVVADPSSRMTRNDVPFATFRLASTPRRVDTRTGEYVNAGTSFVNVTAFRSLGVNVATCVRKGHPVVVHGRMRVNQWTGADGRSGTTVEIDALTVGFDMSKGASSFVRALRPSFGDQQHSSAGGPGARAVDGGREEPTEEGGADNGRGPSSAPADAPADAGEREDYVLAGVASTG